MVYVRGPVSEFCRVEKVVLECAHDKVDPCLERQTWVMPDPADETLAFACCLDEPHRGQQLLPLVICDREGEDRQSRLRFGTAIWNQERDNEAFSTFPPLLTKQRKNPRILPHLLISAFAYTRPVWDKRVFPECQPAGVGT